MKIFKNNIFIALICLFYFLFLLPFYSIKYFIPDVFLYFSFAQNHFIAWDGFSTLFIKIASLLDTQAPLIHLIMLVFMTCGLYLFFQFVRNETNDKDSIIGMGLILSSGIWFYFYGKMFYELPFFILSFGMVLYFLTNKKYKFLWFTMGFALSWKPTFIFPCLGFVSLLLINKQYCQSLFRINALTYKNSFQIFTKSFIVICMKYILLIVAGYLVGNFGFFYNPKQVLIGIAAYPASYDYLAHLFSNNRILWDHVNSVSVNLGTFFIPSAFIIFFITPLFVKNILYLVSSVILNILYFLFISYKSPGFLWHSFPMGIYLIIFGIFILKESEEQSAIRKKIIQILMVVAVGVQLGNNYFIYLPKQITWHKIQQETVLFLQKNALEIVSNIQDIRLDLEEESNYILDFYRDIFIDRQRKNILNETVPAFVEKSKSWHEYGDKKYTLVIYIDSMNQDSMSNVYSPVFSARKVFLHKKYNEYSISIYENKIN